ncbi:MBL fold metallo-hydrolase [Actinacidiphila yeochonensis]|uniref:MBL fold metallo-hydrolase n=1 Tax=Actinacidiphila yeochonensis TaxID=89050 RepID=UPI0007C7E39A|nr:MBL fold metallo-hydrolase [Actinacidiphila yeochonensis]
MRDSENAADTGQPEGDGSVWEQLGPGVARRRLPHLDVTIGLVVGADGVLLVDTGSTLREGAELRSQVADLTGGRSVTHVVLTHGHVDHVLGSAAFEGAEVYAARGLGARLAREAEALRAEAVELGTDPAEAAEAVAALLLAPPTTEVGGDGAGDGTAEGVELDLGGRAVLLVRPGPGHTRHDLAVFVPGATASDPAVVFCGDLVEESGEPQAGPDAVPSGWPAAVDTLLALGGETARYVPGHGAVVDARFLRAQRDELARRAAGPGSAPAGPGASTPAGPGPSAPAGPADSAPEGASDPE